MTVKELTIEIGAPTKEKPEVPKVTIKYSPEPIEGAKPGAACYIFNTFGQFDRLELLVKELDFDGTGEGEEIWVDQNVKTGIDDIIINTLISNGLDHQVGTPCRVYTVIEMLDANLDPARVEDSIKDAVKVMKAQPAVAQTIQTSIPVNPLTQER